MAGLVFAGIAAAIHVYIFYMESFAWTSEKARATFGTTVAQAEATKEMAYNQGFYNLFLAIASGAGIVLYALDRTTIGATLVLTGTVSMAAAGTVLLLSSPDKASSALKQLLPPLFAAVVLVVGLMLR
ncbi:MAG: DUF1304 domain-containing protein [Thermomicrobiales bacterium]